MGTREIIATEATNTSPPLSSRRRVLRTAAVVFAGLLAGTLGACTSADPPGARPGSTQDRTEQSAASTCPDPHGGVCLGDLEAGTYSTTSFKPKLQYTVPSGWANAEDLPGNVLLGRPGDPQVDVWGGSYIGVYQNVRAAAKSTRSPSSSAAEFQNCITRWDPRWKCASSSSTGKAETSPSR